MLRKLFDRPEQVHSIWNGEETAQPRTEILLDPASPSSAHVMLRKKPHEVRLQVVPGSEVSVGLQTISNPDQHGTKAGIVWVKFLDKNGLEVASRGRISKGRQGHYVYITPDALGSTDLTLYVPYECTDVVLGFALWKAYAGSLSLGNAATIKHGILPPFAAPQKQGDQEPRHQRVSISPNHAPDSEIELLKEPLWLNLSTLDAKHLIFQGQFRGSETSGLRDAVVMFRFLDKNGAEVGSLTDIPRGPVGEYIYLAPDSSGAFSFEVHAPADCASVSVGIAAWHAVPGRLKLINGLNIDELTSDSANELRPGYGPPQPASKAFRFDRLHDVGSNIAVSPRPRWARIPIAHIKTSKLQVRFTVTPRIEGMSKKSALALIDFADSDGGSIAPSELSTSEQHGAYKYIDGRSPNEVSLSLSIPRNATEIRVGTMLWAAAADQLLVSNQVWVESTEQSTPTSTKKQAASSSDAPQRMNGTVGTDDGVRRARDLKVALIADEFTYNCFKYEFIPIIIEPQNWRERFEEDRPDLFICESAWSGVDSERRPWKGRVYTSSNFARENRTELLEILDWCNRENIPTVFWNKEDPTHFDDKVHNFIDTAVRFDHVFTTDLTCVAGYKEEYGHTSVHCLPFATQPKLFNPIETSPRADGVSFAGSWYANHLARSREMGIIFDQILDAGMKLRIFDRFWGSDDELHHFPAPYQHLTEPAIPHAKIADAYKSTSLGLNINTVTSSPTMFARRIFELMSCNTLVVSNYSQGVAEFFDGRILFAGEGYSDLEDLNPDTTEEIRRAALHDVLANHTYQRRFEQILDGIGFSYLKTDRLVTLVCPVESEFELKQAIARQAEFVDIADRLIIVLGRTFRKSDIPHLQAKYGRFGVVIVSWAWANHEELNPATYMKGDVFALIAPDSRITAKQIYEASLHRSYVDGPIAMGSDQIYKFTTDHMVLDIIAGREFFQKAIKSYGENVSDNFFLV
ncbi:spore maturation protein CgeB [Paenarthrobacter sp. TE4293]|uniref:CgeB family protein n=1 Tax=Paenarthrobacter sp. TE4293 TaxID=3381695 RepID=UPI003D23DFF5